MNRSTIVGLIISVLIIAAIVGGLVLLKGGQFAALGAAGAEMQMPPETVTSVEAVQESCEQTIAAVGSVQAVQGIQVSTEVSGVVKEVAFESGQEVAQGDVLIYLDATTEEAQLRSAKARAELAAAERKRSQELLAKKVVSESDLDTKEAEYKQAQAEVDNLASLMEKKTIRAPFAGRLGLRDVDPGEFLNVGSTIVSLQAMDPVFVDFMLPQQDLARIREGLQVKTSTDAYAGRAFDGKISAIDADLEVATRSIKVRATVPNTDKLLRPGMYVTVEIVLPQQEKVISIPGTAVLYAPYGDSVYVIQNETNDKGEAIKKIKLTSVRLGTTKGNYVAVEEGLEAGQTIVSTGVFKLRNEAAVVVDNTLQPDMEIDPSTLSEG